MRKLHHLHSGKWPGRTNFIFVIVRVLRTLTDLRSHNPSGRRLEFTRDAATLACDCANPGASVAASHHRRYLAVLVSEFGQKFRCVLSKCWRSSPYRETITVHDRWTADILELTGGRMRPCVKDVASDQMRVLRGFGHCVVGRPDGNVLALC